MASPLDDLLGSASTNDSAKQIFLWSVVSTLLGAVFSPILTEIAEEMWDISTKAGMHQSLSPDELATQVVRGWITQDSATASASRSGVNSTDFDNMVNNRRNPISPEEAAVALRRGIIPETADPSSPSYENAIMQGNLGDQWAPVIKQLATQIPSPADILRAALQAQIPDGTDPKTLYAQVGGDPDYYELMFNTQGAAPTPEQAARMAYRGVIPWTGQGPGVVSFEQAFLEGPWRNKWLPAFRAETAYLPPPRTVTAMLKEGTLTVAMASELLTKQGLTPDLVAAYIASASSTKSSTTQGLTAAEIQTLFQDNLLTGTQATGLLTNLGLTAQEAGYLLKATEAKRAVAAMNVAVTKVQTAYLAKRIDRSDALSALTTLEVPADQAASILASWDIALKVEVKTLSAAQVAGLLYYQIEDQATCQALLVDMGYSPLDAWYLLSERNHAPLPDKPAA